VQLWQVVRELTTREDLGVGVIESNAEYIAVMFTFHNHRWSIITERSLHIP